MDKRILRRPAVEHQIGLSKTQIYALMAEGAFPRPIKIGTRAVGWVEADVAAWINQKIDAAKHEGSK